ncbi:cyanoexosortase A system-associated protein [Pleurocapsa sp. PCC 7319]|uniref:cyanoexosortase A system-associated protein n=1 Tax=Pleurocapsa sp. PCC 7319 TaxID=118161 RepID=UPI00037861C1|nr:cyanoexosortase A system-associated protein [Pleurocapsa sp. PCC 7319]
MIDQMHWRSCVLAIASVGTNLAVVYGMIAPTVGNRPVADFEFPGHLSLNSTQAMAVKSRQVSRKTDNQEQEIIKAHQKYQYIQDNQKISLDISYLVGTRGDVNTYLQQYTDIEPKTIQAKKVKHIEGVGYHALFTTSDRQAQSKNKRAYLSSCISPRSPSNVTQEQFSQFRYQNDLQLQVGLDWLQGKASIRDRRCLWVLLSTPIMQSDPKTAYQVLENAWQDLYRWWLPNFPALTN